MKVSIIGAGTMGRGIAQVASTYDCPVVLYDTSELVLENAKTSLAKIMARLVEKKRVTQESAANIQDRIQYTTDIKRLSDSELIIEAILENEDIKKSVFKKVESLVSSDCIIATNTSSLSITSLASSLSNSERFIGIHFFNPAPLMRLVEIIPALQTDSVVIKRIKEILTAWSKVIVLAKDTPGFIVNKVARPFYGEALRILDEGLTQLPHDEAIATIDKAMKEIGGFKMGPFALMDFIGNDINYAVTESVFKAYNYDPRYRPSHTQKRLSEAGYLGRKAGRGYYVYGEGKIIEPVVDKEMGHYIVNRIVTMLINEAADTLHYGIATIEDIDTAMTKGVNYPKGLFAWADEIGIQNCVNRMDELYHEYHEERYRCSPLLRKMASAHQTFYP